MDCTEPHQWANEGLRTPTVGQKGAENPNSGLIKGSEPINGPTEGTAPHLDPPAAVSWPFDGGSGWASVPTELGLRWANRGHRTPSQTLHRTPGMMPGRAGEGSRDFTHTGDLHRPWGFSVPIIWPQGLFWRGGDCTEPLGGRGGLAVQRCWEARTSAMGGGGGQQWAGSGAAGTRGRSLLAAQCQRSRSGREADLLGDLELSIAILGLGGGGWGAPAVGWGQGWGLTPCMGSAVLPAP